MHTFQNRAITKIQVENVDSRDYPDFVDAFISSAVWADTDLELSDHELDLLNDQRPDIVQELAVELFY